MKNALLKKTAITAVLLALLAISIIPANVLLVKADPIGVGKFLTVEIQGEGYVTATKVNSGEVWTYPKTNPPTENKLGAGTVSLKAFASEGWEFYKWEGDLSGATNPVDYKSEKYGYVTAIFKKKVFKITALVAQEAPNGSITTSGNGVPTGIPGGWSVTIEYGGSQTFEFYPQSNNHVSAIQVDSAFITSTTTYTFANVKENHALKVYFSLDGQAYVPAGSNVPVNLGNNVGLTFASITGGGTATQAQVILNAHPDLQGTSLILWNVNVGATFSGIVEITLPYTGTQTVQKVWTSNSLDALYADVNGNGVVDGDDVSDVAVGIKTTVSSGAVYNANFDVNRDGELTEADVHLVNQYKGTILQSLNFWVVGNTLFIQTDHFSIFRGR